MLLLNAATTADLTDLYKSALICDHLTLDFAIGEDDEGVIAVETAGVLGGLQIAFEIMGLQIPEITDRDVAEYCEINNI